VYRESVIDPLRPAQRRKFAQLLAEGKISNETFEEVLVIFAGDDEECRPVHAAQDARRQTGACVEHLSPPYNLICHALFDEGRIVSIDSDVTWGTCGDWVLKPCLRQRSFAIHPRVTKAHVWIVSTSER
jgi:hypothetical protein